MEAILSFISSLFDIISSFLPFLCKREKDENCEKKIKQFKWENIEVGVSILSKKIAEDFEPEIIMCSSTGASGIIANLYFLTNDKFIPIICGNHRKVKSRFTAPVEENTDLFFKTNKWEVYLPNELKKYSDKKILIIEDVVLSGDSLEREKELVRKCGYKSANVRSAALFVSTVAIYSGNQPDYYWFKLDDSISYYYPWGRNIFGKGYDI